MSILVTSNIVSRVLRVKYRYGPASALYFDVHGHQFILTAHHAFEGLQPGDKIEVRFRKDWVPISVRDVEPDDSNFDICAIMPMTKWGAGLTEEMTTNSILVGEEVAFVGYPLDLETYSSDGELGWPMGLVKSGIFSGSVPRKSDGRYRYFFDAFNNRGFSGGPILVQQNKTLKVAALVSEYWNDRTLPIMRRDPSGVETSTDYFIVPNSGFMVGVPIKLGITAAMKILARQQLSAAPTVGL
jgi:hypothetical protein